MGTRKQVTHVRNTLRAKYPLTYKAKSRGGMASRNFRYLLMSFCLLAFQTRKIVKILNVNGMPDSTSDGLNSPIKCSTSKKSGQEKNITTTKMVRSMAPHRGLKK